ncbi:lipocalin family protein [Bacteroides sp.]
MKTLRFIGMAIIAVILSVNFTACSDDDDDESKDAARLVGKWKIENIVYEGETEEWDGYPYFVVTTSNIYFTDEAGTAKSDNSTYTYDVKSKTITAKYVNGDETYIIKVVKLTDTELQWQWDEDDKNKWTTFYCKKAV